MVSLLNGEAHEVAMTSGANHEPMPVFVAGYNIRVFPLLIECE
jgi:hypothetical protein